jgi:ferredoxin
MTWIVDDLAGLAAFLRGKGTVYAPVGDGGTYYGKLAREQEPELDSLTDVSARHLFQPMTHYYLKFEDQPNADAGFRDFDTAPRVVLGMRPCDLRGLEVHDRVFAESESYRKLRSATTIVGYLCPARESSCFCDSMGGDPLSREGMDVSLYRTDDGTYVVTAETDRGRALMDGAPFAPSGQAPPPKFAEADHPKLEAVGLAESLNGTEESDGWEDIGFACVNCRVCTYVCPTCHCFTVTDEVFGTEGGRATVWDSCQAKSFTKEASGHNPRAGKPERVRQRILHKYNYYPKLHGALMCSGCGRCIKGCPTGRNIVEELTLLRGGSRS